MTADLSINLCVPPRSLRLRIKVGVLNCMVPVECILKANRLDGGVEFCGNDFQIVQQ